MARWRHVPLCGRCIGVGLHHERTALGDVLVATGNHPRPIGRNVVGALRPDVGGEVPLSQGGTEWTEGGVKGKFCFL